MDESTTFEKLLDERFGRVHDKLDGIIAQTTKTNGRVNNLEEWQDEHRDMIECIKEERIAKKSNLSGVIWEIIKFGAMGTVIMVGNAIWLIYFAK